MKSTKKAFVFSLLSVLLCVSMLIGTTFAWFTDTATSSNNRIVAGNLDVDLVMYNGTDYVSIAGGSGDIFDTAAIAQNKPASLWEPGKTQIVYLGVQNKGNLAIKYNIVLDVTDTDTTDGVNLADVLDFAIIDGAKAGNTNYTNWATVTNAASTTGVIGTLMGTNPARITAAQNGTLDEIRNGTQNETNYFVLAVHMQETAGNEYQGKEIVIDLSVVATQKDAEEDSFNNQYDAGLDTPTAPTAIHDIATATFEEPAEITTDTTGKTPVSTATVAATTIQTTDATSTIAAPTTVTLSDYTAPTATDTTDKVTGLTRTIDTTASSETGVTYNIGYKATVTTTTNNVVVGTEEYAVHTFGSIVENVVNVGAGLTNVTVTHGTTQMTKANNTTAKADGTYYYDSATGDLYIWSSTYSAYTISWDVPDYVATIGTNGYMTFKGALNAAKDGDTVKLLKDVSITSNTTISENIIIDLNGNTMTQNRNVTSAAKVSIKNGKINESSYFTVSNGAENAINSLSFENVELTRNQIGSPTQLVQLYGKQYVSVKFENCVLKFNGTDAAPVVGFTGGTYNNCAVNFANTQIDWSYYWVTFSSKSGTECCVTFDSVNEDKIYCDVFEYKVIKETEANGTKFYSEALTKWVDKVSTQPAEFVIDESGNVSIGSEDALAYLSKTASSKSYAGKTITLTADLNMSGYLWTPIKCAGSASSFEGTFDGNNHTISNIIAKNDQYGTGLFYSVIGTVKDLTMKNALIGKTTNGNVVGIVTGYAYNNVTFDNITIEDCHLTGFGKVGAIIGMAADPDGVTTVINCVVKDTTIKGTYNVATFIGMAQNTVAMSNCTYSGVVYEYGDDESSYVTLGENTITDNNVDVSGGIYWLYPYGNTYYYPGWANYYTDYIDDVVNGFEMDGHAHNTLD